MPRVDLWTGSRRSTSDRGTLPAPIRFPPDNFKHSLTLFSKSFSSFPRGTCSLSVSRQYLALDGIYRPIGAAFPNNPTRRQRLVVQQGPGPTGLSPSPAPPSRGLGPGPPLRTLLQTTIRTPRATDSHGGLFPVRSPLLRESLRPTDPHGSKSRKAGGGDTHDRSRALAQPPSITAPSTADSVFNQPRALGLLASGATCIQRLDGSRDSAIHTKYRISLRSSSMQEPRYPLPRVFRISVSQRRPHEHRLRADGGELNDFNFLGAFRAGVLLLGQEDTAEGSPTETLLRLLLPLNDKVQWTSHNVAGSEPPTSPQSEHFTGPFNRQIAPPTKNGHAPPPIESRKSSQSVNPYYVWTCLHPATYDRDSAWKMTRSNCPQRHGKTHQHAWDRLLGRWGGAPWHAILTHQVLSRLFDARGRGPEGPVPNPSPDRHAATRSRRESSSSSPPTADGFGTGTPVPSPQSQSFSRGYGSILPTSLAYIVPSTRGCSPWRPDAVMSTTGRGRHSVLRIFKGHRGRTGHHPTYGALPAVGPYLRLSRFQGGQAICTDDRSARAHAPGFAATAAPSYSSGPGPCPDGRVSAQLGTVTQLPVHPASPVLLTKNGPLGAFDSVAWLNKAATLSYLFKAPAILRETSSRSGIVHHLSGPDRYALTRTLHRRSGSVGGATHKGIPPISFLAPYGFTCPLTRTHVRLLGPCFKTGRMGSPQAVGPNGEPAGRRQEHAVAEAHQTTRASNHNRDDDVSTSISTARAWATIRIRVVLFIFPSRYLFAIGLSPVFSLGRNLPPDWGCIPKQPDSPTAPRGATGGLGPGPPLRTLLQTTIRTPRATDSHGGLFPVRSPLLRESLRPTDPHGSKSRKAGGGDTHDRSRALAQPPSITAPSTADSVFNQPRALGLMASGATCVQRLDGSRDSAIHTKYRISLRSSSMQEPRYPLPRVFRISVSQRRPHEHRLRADGGELNDFNFLGAFRAGVLLLGQEDTAEGSPTETLLRLLLPLNDKVQWTSHNVASGEPPTSPQSSGSLSGIEPRFKASREARPPRGGHQRHVPLGGRGPLLLVGKRATGTRIASSPDSDLEAFSHNPTHVLSRLFDARGRGPEGPVPNPSPDRHAATRSRRESSSSSPPTADGFGTGTPVPSPQSQSFSRGYGSILPTSLAYIVPSTRGCSPWRPDAVMSTTGRGRHSVLRIFKGRRGRTGHHATCGALPAAGPYLRLSRFQGGQAICTNDRSSRAHALGFAATAAPSYSSGPGPYPDGRVSAQLGTVTQLPVHPASPVLLTKNGPLGALDSVAWLNKAATPSYLFKVCSHSNPSQKIRVGRRCNPQGDPTNQLPCALRVYLPADSHTCQTPWSVFQDGPNGEPAGRRPEHAGAEAHQTARASNHNRDDDVSTSMSTNHHNSRRSMPRVDWRTGSRRSTSDRGTSPAPIRFPPDNFKHSLTLFSKSFSSFPRGTCSLSVSRQYLALDGIYRPIGAAFPNNPTRRQRLVVRQGPGTTGLSPSPAPPSRGLGPGPPLRTLLQTTIRTPRATDSHGGLFPVRSPLLRESLLVSFPPLIDMLAVEDASPDYNSDTEGDQFSWWAFPSSLAVTKRPTDPHGSKSRKAGGGDTHDRSRALAQPPSITAPSTADSVFNQPRALGLMASGATCVQRLDGSRDSAIHTKYRISLRSSSMQEPRYPLPRVFRISVSQRRPHEHRLRADGGELNDFNFLGAFRAGVLLLGQEDTAEGVAPPDTRGTEVPNTSSHP
ncbi:hypothetical protein TanjilG_29985 [Lupinus angustifolius]|uniref:Protein TAR1 n=2 Tax=Lupinus angustifolius TaxID=3871 RepID=A0A1J7HNF4_LUPAN|nr:hypothetical protein TanjilG_29985 [Lupinus angustifolius]